ncbi:MAG: FCD domain-containing protein [Chloroflexi bacterium]|nr:FCD domain-containing protein [Chloroflexota bacterium]MCL5109025.1 FCD domain-containing protein [Chloroflexota bacterium]
MPGTSEQSAEDVGRTRHPQRDQAIYLTLQALAGSAGPAGCWRLRDALRGAGLELSEATVGRLLREFDYLGYSERVGSKGGRIITAAGRVQLASLEQSQHEDTYREQFLRAIRVESLADILDLLSVRRAIEGETARLAATRATADDLVRLRRRAREHAQAVRQGGSGSEENNRFHLAIAQASGSRVALAVLALILQDRQVHRTQTEVQRSMDSVVPEEHQRVLAAIETRRPEEAFAAMRAHIDRLMQSVELFAARQTASLEGVGSASEDTAAPAVAEATQPAKFAK